MVTPGEHTLEPESASERFLSVLRQSSVAVTEVERRRETIAGLDAVQVRAVATEEGEGIQYLLTFLRGARRSYQVACWSTDGDYPAQEPDFRALLAGFAETAD
jgi:hypothetical protein